MSTMQQLRQGLSRAWDSVAEGWRELRDRTGEAITRFTPSESDDERSAQSDDQLPVGAARWGLLAADVADNKDHVDVRLEAPGLEPGDFKLEVVGDMLVVRGEKQASRERREGHFHIMERAYGHFERAIRLPAEVDDTRAEAHYRRGVLEVRLPKAKAAKSRRIAVSSK